MLPLPFASSSCLFKWPLQVASSSCLFKLPLQVALLLREDLFVEGGGLSVWGFGFKFSGFRFSAGVWVCTTSSSPPCRSAVEGLGVRISGFCRRSGPAVEGLGFGVYGFLRRLVPAWPPPPLHEGLFVEGSGFRVSSRVL